MGKPELKQMFGIPRRRISETIFAERVERGKTDKERKKRG